MYFNPRSLAGATVAFSREAGIAKDFNPRSLAGATLIFIMLLCEPRFQSTLPRGSDIIRRSSELIGNNFNPRSLAGATTTTSKIL